MLNGWAGGSLLFVNLYAFRSTNPKVLRGLTDIKAQGPDNPDWLMHAALMHHYIICGWGAFAGLHTARDAWDLFTRVGCKPMCLGLTKHKAPWHPLYLPNSAPLIDFPRP